MPGQASRADAVRNRERILEVAHQEFAVDGSVSLNAIARRAGVGAGTMYRHFPTRDALLLAVYRNDLLGLAETAAKRLTEQEPLDAFRAWFTEFAAYVRGKDGLGDALTRYAPVTAAVRTLVDAGMRDGCLRPGLDPADILLLMSFLWRVPPGEAGDTQATRIMELVINGLTARPVGRGGR